MTGIQLFRAIGSVDDDLVEAAAEAKAKRPPLKLAVLRWAAAAAVLALVAGLSVSRLTATPQLAPLETLMDQSRAMTMSSPAGMRKLFNYGGYRYAFVGDGAPYDFSQFELTRSLGTLDTDILAGMDSGGDNEAARADLATTFALGGTVYEIPGYDPAFRLAVTLDGQTYLAELAGRVDNEPLGAEYFFTVSGMEAAVRKAHILPHMGEEPLRSLGRRDARGIVEILSGSAAATLTNEDYENIARTQLEGGSWQLELALADGTNVRLYVIPELNLVSIGDDYYTLPEEFAEQYGGIFEGLEQQALPYS